MSELKAIDDLYERRIRNGSDPYKIKLVDVRHPPVYLKSEADNVIAEKDAEIARLKNGIAPKQSDKTLQERLNEVCEKHGVSTLQDLDCICSLDAQGPDACFALYQSHTEIVETWNTLENTIRKCTKQS